MATQTTPESTLAVPGVSPARVVSRSDRARAVERRDSVLFHLLLLSFFVALHCVLLSTREMSADNFWHFQLARDILSGRQIYWAGVDANRFFPDLLFAMAGLLLPRGGDYPVWIYYYYAVSLGALYLSLVALAATLFDDQDRRRLFLFCSVVASSVLMGLFPFWGFWTLAPGNHGGGLSICFFALALLFWMNRSQVVSVAGTLAFVAVVVLLVASNRLLLITFVAPLVLALLAHLALRWRSLRHSSVTTPSRARDTFPLPILIVAAAISGAGGLLAWSALNSLDWYELVARAGEPFPSPSLDWLVRTVRKEQTEIVSLWKSSSYAVDIYLGILLLLAAAFIGLRSLVQARGYRSLDEENRALLASFAALSALAAIAFTIIKTDESEAWHYRFLTTPTIFAIIAMSALSVRSIRLPAARPVLLGGAAAVLAGLFLVIALVASTRQVPAANTEAGFQGYVRQLAATIARHSNRPKLTGYAEYWLANAATTHSDRLQIGTLDSIKPEFRFYNNNAADVCDEGHSFVALSSERDEPRKAAVLALLGEPIRTDQIVMTRFGTVSVLYYDPELLKARITLPAREQAARLFPSIKCKPSR